MEPILRDNSAVDSVRTTNKIDVSRLISDKTFRLQTESAPNKLVSVT